MTSWHAVRKHKQLPEPKFAPYQHVGPKEYAGKFTARIITKEFMHGEWWYTLILPVPNELAHLANGYYPESALVAINQNN